MEAAVASKDAVLSVKYCCGLHVLIRTYLSEDMTHMAEPALLTALAVIYYVFSLVSLESAHLALEPRMDACCAWCVGFVLVLQRQVSLHAT